MFQAWSKHVDSALNKGNIEIHSLDYSNGVKINIFVGLKSAPGGINKEEEVT